MPRLRLRWAVPGLLGLGAGVWFGVPLLLQRVSFFAIQRIEVVGARYTTVGQVHDLLALPPDANLFDPTEPLVVRVRELPGLRSVHIRRRLPGALQVVLQEEVPVGLAMVDGALRLVDGTGGVLPFDPTIAPPDLPIVSTDPPVVQALSTVRLADPAMYHRVTTAQAVPLGVALDVPDGRYLIRVGCTTQEIHALRAVLDDLGASGHRYREVDARFAGRIIVRGRRL